MTSPTSESGRAGAVEVGDQVDAGGAVGAGARPALVPVCLAVRPREAVLAVAMVSRPFKNVANINRI